VEFSEFVKSFKDFKDQKISKTSHFKGIKMGEIFDWQPKFLLKIVLLPFNTQKGDARCVRCKVVHSLWQSSVFSEITHHKTK
jgi:hypothetical protein